MFSEDVIHLFLTKGADFSRLCVKVLLEFRECFQLPVDSRHVALLFGRSDGKKVFLDGFDRLELVVLPLLFGGGMQLTPALSPGTGLAFESERALPGGSVEIVYSVTGNTGGSPAREAGWFPASQRPK